MVLNRRNFLKLSGMSVGTLLAAGIAPGKALMAAGEEPAVQKPEVRPKAVLFDGTKCIGCKSCEVACKRVNGLPLEETPGDTNGEIQTWLSAYTFTRIGTKEVEYKGTVRSVSVKFQCMHCLHPACVEACIVGALQKRPDGPVTYDKTRCIGCRYCQVACPFGIPNFEWDKPVPWIRKCEFCFSRQDEGLEPMCVSICPNNATIFGERDELLAVARERIATTPGKYVNYIYGENEVGGTSWLYLSPVPFETLGFAPHITEPVTLYAARAMGLVPSVLMSVLAVMTGVYWLTKRRKELIRVETGEEEKKGDEEQ